jgi:hypothetical protein
VVSFEPIENILTVGFSELRSGEGRYVLLQKAQNVSEQNRKLGLVGEYLELNDQLYGGYGTVQSVRLYRHRLELLIAADARAKIGQEEIDVAFNLSDADFRSLRSALAEILGTPRVHLV